MKVIDLQIPHHFWGYICFSCVARKMLTTNNNYNVNYYTGEKDMISSYASFLLKKYSRGSKKYHNIM